MIAEKAQPQELKASRVASLVSVALALFKLTAGISTGSLSLLASAFDSSFDAMTSFAGYILLRKSLEPADREHPFGHSRIESIASFGQGALLFIIALALAYAASLRFDHLHEPQHLEATLYVPALCAAITLALWIYLGQVVKNTGSSIIAGDRLHYFSDLAGNVLLVLGFTVSRVWHLYNVDAILTVVLSLFMFSGAVKITLDAVTGLVDHSDIDAEKEIEKIIEKFYPEALGVHKIRSRRSGRRTAMDIELLSCRRLMFQEVHNISHNVQKKITELLPNIDTIIHSEPCHSEQCPTDETCKYSEGKKSPR